MSKVFQKTNIYIPQGQSQDSPSRQVLFIEGNGGHVFATAPVTGIKIEEQVDFNLSKTLHGNFNLTVFQDLPVVISLTGVQALADTCNGRTDDISALYKDRKAGGEDPIKITIKDAVYEGIIVAFSQQSIQDFPCVALYNITLFGVRVE